MKTRIVAGYLLLMLMPAINSCTKDEQKPVVEKVGCMDRAAYNYDSTATKECDNCCVYLPSAPNK